MEIEPTQKAEKRDGDAVDNILAQWHRERPDLDVSPMGVIGRLKRCAALVQLQLDATFAEFDMSGWEFDMLATLRRSGAPYRLAPTALFSTLMVTSGTMTHRLQRLEARGWIARVANPDDARSTLVQLTDAGFALIEQAVEAHVANEHRMLAPLTKAALADIESGLSAWLRALEAGRE
ncbi:MarR family winged helix-turn-helix transcriptional regulator [Pandoraea apista]|nr:MarR family transcriptional regulator [Pandoraea apista]AJE97250.1 MarR family transcriptional regulator [Pandoraea apista]AKH71214.1 MarR family transcriptional regulator [Pandoraea apista]AKI63486.1 MarR family transcriptional regulator [Pandoraea apista]ALS67403.1 MarR family transcriptional regulator [Pandoraea apista]OXS97672.1 MarR family transcriptional regulator [Pandoraea apista]